MSVEEKIRALGGMRKVRPATWRLPTPADLREVERAIGAALPDDYREFISVHSVSAFAEPYVVAPLQEPAVFGQDAIISVFFGFSADGAYSLNDEMRTYQGRMPPNFLPIADDPGGNVVCLAVGGRDAGNVYYWDHEHANLGEGRVMEMFDELDRRGFDTSRMTPHDAICEWEKLHASELQKPPGYSNVYRLGASFEEFVRGLKHEPA